MPGLEDLERAIARLEDAEARCKEQARLAHEAAAAAKEQRQLLNKELDERLGKVDEMIEAQVEKGLKEYTDTVKKASQQIYDKIGRECDKLILLTLGKTRSRNANTYDLRPQLAEHLRVWLRDQIGKYADDEKISIDLGD